MLFFSLLILVATANSVISGQSKCTNVPFRDLNARYKVPIGPIQIVERVSNVTFTNDCQETKGMLVWVCDDVAPNVRPVTLHIVTVERLGTAEGPINLTGTYFCN